MNIHVQSGLMQDVKISRRENPQSQQRFAGHHADDAQTHSTTLVIFLVGGNGINQHGVLNSINPGNEAVDPYVTDVLQQLQSGQAQARVAGADGLPMIYSVVWAFCLRM